MTNDAWIVEPDLPPLLVKMVARMTAKKAFTVKIYTVKYCVAGGEYGSSEVAYSG